MTTVDTTQTQAAGKTKTEVRYWSCSVCGHREWATTAEWKEWIPNPAPMQGGMWRFRKTIDPVWCQCQAKTEKAYRPRTMKMYKNTLWLGPGEALPNIGIRVTLQDTLEGSDPVPENAIGETPKEVIPLVMPVAPIVPSPLTTSGDPVAVVDPTDPDAMFDLKTGQPDKESKPL